jgi:secreted PhoX family phosphatase
MATTIESTDNVEKNALSMRSLGEIISRRTFLGGVLATGCASTAKISRTPDSNSVPSRKFFNLPPILDTHHHVAEGYEADILISWGDPLFVGQSAFQFDSLTGEEQAQRFGYNNDFLALIEEELQGKPRTLLVVNHESTSAQLMFVGQENYVSSDVAHADIERMAHGLSVLELQNIDGKWRVVQDSPFTRRITVDTPMRLSGPLAGHERMRTPEDPEGTIVLGTLHNCSGGKTPWGTILTCEENILYYFRGEFTDNTEIPTYKRYNIGYSKSYLWNLVDKRWDLTHAPKQPNRYGWVVEVDPTDPNSTPVKRTALGRMYHESANPILHPDGRVVIYMGDDGYFEYLYRFVSRKPFDPNFDKNNRMAMGDILDDGVLSVAKFHEDGRLTWIPLEYGTNGLSEENGFFSQADVLLNARTAGDIVGATPLDRVEDVEPNPHTHKIYLNCSTNKKRATKDFPGTSAESPRAENWAGHIIELTPPDGDHASPSMKWDILLLAGSEKHHAQYGFGLEEDAFFACPDNAAIDPDGKLWISTDGSNEVLGIADGLYAVETDGDKRGQSKRLFAAPKGAEVTGPCFSADGCSLFISIQHPDATDVDLRNSWPDFTKDHPPRPSVLVIRRKDGGVIGS